MNTLQNKILFPLKHLNFKRYFIYLKSVFFIVSIIFILNGYFLYDNFFSISVNLSLKNEHLFTMLTILFKLIASYNVYRGDCEAILGNNYYNLTAFGMRDADMISSSKYNYFLRLCPDKTSTETYEEMDVFLMQCNDEKCNNLITQNELNYKPLNPKDFSQGIVYHANGEPYLEDGVFKTIDLEFRIKCNKNSKGINIPFETKIDDKSVTGSFIVTMESEYGCPIQIASPTPTPLFQPDCKFEKRMNKEPKKGIKVDMKNLNDGPFGIKVDLNIDNQQGHRTLYYQPCERMMCPPTFTCEEEPNDYSSAWLCDLTER